MTQSLIILGRQPSLGLAELESLYGSKVLKPLSGGAVLIDMAPRDIDFDRLGGSVKLCTLLNILDSSEWRELESYLTKMIPEHLQYVPEGKFKLGISTYGLRVRPNDINTTNLRLKKIIKAGGRSVRVIPNKAAALNSAQVLHNQLTSPTGWELVFYRTGNKTYLGLTSAEQDIESYARRDQNRPMRDAKVGMLPPKLAQIIINLATQSIEQGAKSKETSALSPKPLALAVLDPFCGTGVLVQEALLMGYKGYGSDIDPRMGEYYRGNMDWLASKYPNIPDWSWQLADATKDRWEDSQWSANMLDVKRVPLKIDFVAAETYLGKPLSREPEERLLHKIMDECDLIHRGFLENIGKQIKKGTRLCLAVPAWKTKSGFQHLPTLDKLKNLGYTRISFVHVPTREMLYYRDDQYVARELVVLIKN